MRYILISPLVNRDRRIKGNYYIKLRNVFIKIRTTICTSQKISEKSHTSTQLRKIDLIMGNILTKLVQQTSQQLYSTKLLSPKEVTYEIKEATCDTKKVTCEIKLLPKDLIQKLADLLNHDDALSLNQTCKPFRECVPHKCLPPSTQVIVVDDRLSFENGKPVLSDVIMLSRIPLEDPTWIDLIKCCCPNLKYLFIIYEYKRDYPSLSLDRLLCVEISMKIKMLNMDCLFIHLPSTLEIFTAHISMIDSKAFQTTSGKYIGGIDLKAETLENLKSL
jgi:hypothetical protein